MSEVTDGSVGDDIITLPNVETSFVLPQPNCAIEESDETPPRSLGRHWAVSHNQGLLENRWQVTTNNPLPPSLEGDTVLSFREALLIRNFIERIAPWVSRNHVGVHKNKAISDFDRPTFATYISTSVLMFREDLWKILW